VTRENEQRADWDTCRGLGWPELLQPADDEGSQAGFPYLTILLEEIGRTLSDVPMFSTVSAAACGAGLLPLSAARELVIDRVATGASGTWVDGFGGVGEASIHINLASGQVDGCATAFLDGPPPDFLVVLGECGDGTPALAVIARTTAGVTFAAGIDGDVRRFVSDVSFWRTACSARAVRLADVLRSRMILNVLRAADVVGVAQAVLEETVAHTVRREQFGRPIGTFQSVAHRLVDLHIAITVARSLVWSAAGALGDHSSSFIDASRVAHLAAASASEAAVATSRAAVQFHGAAGLTRGHLAFTSLTRSLEAASILGSSAHHFREAARLDLEKAAR
jgi:alkylation response protein AidB-like acyl-CoA dehydrogenase